MFTLDYKTSQKIIASTKMRGAPTNLECAMVLTRHFNELPRLSLLSFTTSVKRGCLSAFAIVASP